MTARAPTQVVIFDWDGTLMDSVAQIVASVQHAAQSVGLSVSAEAAANIIGLGLPEAMAELFPHHAALRGQIQAEYSRHYVANSQTLLFNGVHELLPQLQQSGALLAVATGKSRAGLDRVLHESGTQHYFAATRGADETASKPDPKMLIEIMDHLGVSPQQCLMVGDTVYDLDMAKRAGVRSIGVTYGVHTRAQLQAFDPIALVDSVTELHALLLDVIGAQ